MRISYSIDAKDFLARAGDKLTEDEARYGLIYGIARRLVGNPNFYGADAPWFCTLENGAELQAIAIRTPPFKVLLAHFSGDASAAAKLMVDAVSQFSPSIPGVLGESKITDLFVESWCEEHEVKIEDKMAQLVYRLDRVNDIAFASGKFRLAGEADRELVSRWAHAFHEELFTAMGRSEPESDFADRIPNDEVFFWEDDVAVSVAVKSRPTNNGISVGYVYTPPELRQKGYATSCVASLCREILKSGFEFCTLYTDLANPISNSVYRKIGFREICDSVMYTFSTATG